MTFKNSVVVLLGLVLLGGCAVERGVSIDVQCGDSPRVGYAARRLRDGLTGVGIEIARDGKHPERIIILQKDPSLGMAEHFVLESGSGSALFVRGSDDSGVLYGCLELIDRIREAKSLPRSIHVEDGPAFKLRGPCIGMQKTYLLEGYGNYIYPYTPELFPFFYDKAQWIVFLDMLAENRMNTLTLWNGHPFSSLVRLEDYPEALDVSEEVFAKNQAMYGFLTAEAEKRGIWVVQMFYNIHISMNLAKARGIPVDHDRPTPLVSDYTRKSIAAFVKNYPHVGLLVCLGEALREEKDVWLRDVILAGVHDGMAQAGLSEEPPIIIREHTMAEDAPAILAAGRQTYSNLYTMMKYNGEALTTYRPRGPWAEIHRKLAAMSPNHISNVHILANLEPFRYGATRFIQKCVQAMRDIHHANGIHLYPLAYWDWPVSPDQPKGEFLQPERDWIWFAAWARYAWRPERDIAQEDEYWAGRLAKKFGCSQQAGQLILEAYNKSGECAPKLLRRFGMTNGNRQTLSLGMTLDQMVRSERYYLFPRLVDSDGPAGERLAEYVAKEQSGQPHKHEGETPVQVILDVIKASNEAVQAIEAAAWSVTANRKEFGRLRNDMHCIEAMSRFYVEKATAAMGVLNYQYSNDISDLKQAKEHLAKSLEAYRLLAALTKNTYRYANSLQTGGRKIPFKGSGGQFKHWTQCLPVYEEECRRFCEKIEMIETAQKTDKAEVHIKAIASADFTLAGDNAEVYTIREGAKVFTDQDYTIQKLAGEIVGLKAIRFSYQQAIDEGVRLTIELKEPAKVLIGYFQGQDSSDWLRPPNPETDAQGAELGLDKPVLRNAVEISGLPGVNVHVLPLDAGALTVGLGKGSFLILGIVERDAEIQARDVDFSEMTEEERNLDWLMSDLI